LAEVIITSSELGTRWHNDALWQDTWGRSFAPCAGCREAGPQIAQRHRPTLVITEAARRPR